MLFALYRNKMKGTLLLYLIRMVPLPMVHYAKLYVHMDNDKKPYFLEFPCIRYPATRGQDHTV